MNLIYCLYGLDQKRIIKKRNEIIKEKDVDDFNISIFDMDEVDINRPLNDASSIPFLTDYRIVVMKNCNFLAPPSRNKKDGGEEKDTSNKKDLSSLLNYISNPSKSTILIMEVYQEKLDQNNKVVKLIKSKKYDLEIKPLTKEEIAVEVVKFCKDNGFQLKIDVKEEIVNRIQGDPMSFDNELEKLALYYNKGDKITLDIVEKLITETSDDTVFTLMNAIMDKDRKKALDTYYDLLEQGNDPLAVQGFVVKRFSQLLYAKELIYANGTQADLQETLKLSPGQAFYLMKDANKVSYKKLARVINELKELDYASKSSYKYGTDKTIGFELFLTKI